MFSTPDLSHLSGIDYGQVYEPAEDSFLLLDALEKEYDFLRRARPVMCMEVGSGSGVVISFLAKLLGPDVYYICTDINGHASGATIKTAEKNKVKVDAVVTDLVDGLLPRLSKQVDVLVFNPPYVITPKDEVYAMVMGCDVTSNQAEYGLALVLQVGCKDLAASWAGGDQGRQVMDRFFPLVPQLLSNSGMFYLVVIKENNPDNIQQKMAEYGLEMEVVLKRQSGPEQLFILKFFWNDQV